MNAKPCLKKLYQKNNNDKNETIALVIERKLKTAIWTKIWDSLRSVPSSVHQTQIWLLVQIAALIAIPVHSNTSYAVGKKVLFAAAIALIIIGLNFGKQWARIIASSVLLSLGLIGLYYLILFIMSERPIDLIELIAFSFFALISFHYIYLAFSLWIAKSAQKHFGSSEHNSDVVNSISTEHIQ